MGVILASASGETTAFLVIGVLGIVLSAAVYLLPGLFDAATRLRLRMQGLPEDDERVLERDRSRRRFIALVLGIGSAAVLVQALTRV
ncbi:MAG: hypothetical protein QOF65_2549 [Thermoleophilaceae bacterium]|nr:hypothetical protein [Thermoleophilaceae bacterium]